MDSLSATPFINGDWQRPYTVLDLNALNSYDQKVAFDDTNTGLIIWVNIPDDNTPSTVLTSYYDGTNFVTPALNPLDTADLLETPAVAMNGSGSGIAIWIDTVGSNVRSSNFTAGNWTAPTTIGTGTGGTSIAYSANNSAVAGWIDGANVVVANYLLGVWQPGITIDAGDYVEVGIDSSGNAIAAWLDAAGNVVVSFFNGITWSANQTISTAPANTTLSFAMAPNGTAVLTWGDWDDPANAFFSSFNGTVWTAVGPIISGLDVAISFGPSISVSVDSGGNALFLCSTETEIRSLRLPLGSSFWINNDLVTNDLTFRVIPLVSALSASTRGFGIWIENSGEGGFTQGSYTSLVVLPTPPLGITGTTCKNKFASQTDCVNRISWTPSTDPTVLTYRVRRNGILIATIPARGPYVFVDHGRCRKMDLYTVTAVNGLGAESSSVSIVLP